MLRRTAGRAAGAVLLALAATGCSTQGTATSNVSITGHTLRIYLSAPEGYQSDPVLTDTVDAEQLAFAQHHGVVTAYNLQLMPVLVHGELSSHARTAISDKTAIAYLGELQPGESEQTVGITNAQDLLQVSPSDTALELTEATPTRSDAPKYYYESTDSFGKTFARIVPNSAVEAKAIVSEMTKLGVKSVYVTEDGTDYGKAVSYALRSDAAAAGIATATSLSAAGAMFYGGSADTPAAAAAAASALMNAAKSNPQAALFGPSGLDSQAFLHALSTPPANLYVSVPAPAALSAAAAAEASSAPSGATGGTGSSGATGAGATSTAASTAAAAAFTQAFLAKYGHQPARQAFFGYESMMGVLSAIAKAGSAADNRREVVKAFFSFTNRTSAVGVFSIGKGGDSNLTSFQLLRVKNGAFAPGPTVQG